MDCIRIRKACEGHIVSLMAKYKGQANDPEAIDSMLIENTNFVMSLMLKECLSLSRGAQT